MSKVCTKCGEEKELEMFYKQKDKKDGRQCHCKECRKNVQREYWKTDAGKAAQRKYKQTKAGKAAHAKANMKYYQTEAGSISQRRNNGKYPERRKAMNAVNHAVSAGRMQRPDRCSVDNEECSGRIEGHHPDYSRPLDVVWLCAYHHKAIHHGVNLLRKTGS